jgi:hypothetical protein
MNSFVGILSIWLWWSNVRIHTNIAGVLAGFETWVRFLLFFHADILGRLGSNLVFIVPFWISYVEFGSELWLVPFGTM